MNWEKLVCPARTTLKNHKLSVNWEQLGSIKPEKIQKVNKKYRSTLKNPNFAFMDELGKYPNLNFTVAKRMGNL